MQQLTDASGFATWKQVYDMAVPYWETTSKNYSGYTGMFSMEGSSGVSHYIPSLSKQAAAAAFRSTDWYKSAGLSKLLVRLFKVTYCIRLCPEKVYECFLIIYF